MVIYQSNGNEYKGNLHMHTTFSDGRLAPLEALKAYEDAGFDFVAITDHRHVTRVPDYQGKMLLLNGIELDEEPSQAEVIHLLGIGFDADFEQHAPFEYTSQQGIDLISRHGGLCFLAHPHWSMNRLHTIRPLTGLSGVEIYNSGSKPPYDAFRADSTHFLDLMAQDGFLYLTIACDDSHAYECELFDGFTLVQADSLTQDGILSALKAGRFYASQGPRFERVVYEEGVARVECSRVSRIAFHSNLAWANERAYVGQGLTNARHTVDARRGESFIRVVIEDEQGRKAWLNPFAV